MLPEKFENSIVQYKNRSVELKAKSETIKVESDVDRELARGFLKDAKTVIDELEDKRTAFVKPYNDVVKQVNANCKEVTLEVELIINGVKTKMEVFDAKVREEKRLEEVRIQVICDNISKCKTLEALDTFKMTSDDAQNTKIKIAIETTRSKINEQIRIDKEKADLEEQKRKQAEIDKIQNEEQKRINQEMLALEEEKRKMAADKAKFEEDKRLEALKKAEVKEEKAEIKATGIRTDWKFEVIDESIVHPMYKSVDEKKVRQAIKEGSRDIAGLRIYEEKNIIIK